MKRNWGRAAVLVAGALVASALAPACASNDQTIFIRAALAPSTNRQNGACLYTSDPQQPVLFQGTLDVGIRDNYFAVLLVGNQLTARADRNNNRAESNRVSLNGAVVRVTNPDGSVINEFTSLATGFADPQSSDQPSYGSIGIVVIDSKTRDQLLAQLNNRLDTKLVLANIRAFGQTLGGVDVESNEYQLPIRVCKGCLVSFANANDVNQQPSPNCKKALEDKNSTPCFAGQDEPTPCQLCTGRPVCDDPLLP